MITSWQESYDKPRQCVKKQRHHFVDKVPYSQGYGLSRSHVQMWELDHKEGRAPKNWCFQTVVLEKTLQEDPWRSNQSILKEVNPEYLLEGLMLKQKLQYFGHMMLTANSLEKTQMLGKIEGRRRRGRQDETVGLHHWLNGQMVREGKPGMLAVHGVAKSQTQLGDWTITTTGLFL